MSYENKKTQEVSRSLLDLLISGDRRSHLKHTDLKTQVMGLDVEAFTQIDKESGRSLWTDAILAPLDAARRMDKSADFQALITRAKTYLDIFLEKLKLITIARPVDFFLPRNSNNLTLFHYAPFWQHPGIAIMYFDAMETLIAANHISRREYALVLMDPDIIPLVFSSDRDNIQRFFSFIKLAADTEEISEMRYFSFLLTPFSTGKNLLAYALEVSSVEAVEIYYQETTSYGSKISEEEWLNLILAAFPAILTCKNTRSAVLYFNLLKKFVPKDKYRDLFLKKQQGQSYLQDILTKVQSLEILELYFNTAYEVLRSRLYQAIFTGRDPSKRRTSMHDAVLVPNPSFFRCYLTALRKAELPPADSIELFIGLNSAKYSPLHYVLGANPDNHSDPENVSLYLQEVDTVVETANTAGLNGNTYAINLLTGTTFNGTTPLLQALNARNPRSVKKFLDYMLAARKKYLNDSAYVQLIIQPNNQGFTPFAQALISNTLDTAVAYVTMAQTAVTEGILSADNYITSLFFKNKQNFSPFLQALGTCNVAIVKLYFDTVKCAVDRHWISPRNKQQYIDSCLQQNDAGDTPLLYALKSEVTEIVEEYFNQMEQMVTQGLITLAQYSELFLKSNKANFSSLTQAFKTSNVQIIRRYLTSIQPCLRDHHMKPEDYGTLLLTPSNLQRTTPLVYCLEQDNSDVLEAYLSSLRTYYMTIQSHDKNKFADELLLPKTMNFTPFTIAARSRDPRSFELFLRLLKDLYDFEFIDKKRYMDLLTVPIERVDRSRKLYATPAHDVCKSGQAQSIVLYFQTIFGIFSEEGDGIRLKHVLITREDDGASCLDYASDNKYCDSQTFAWLLENFKTRLTTDDYLQIAACYERRSKPEKRRYTGHVYDEVESTPKYPKQDHNDIPPALSWTVRFDEEFHHLTEVTPVDDLDYTFRLLGATRAEVSISLRNLAGDIKFRESLSKDIGEVLQRGVIGSARWEILQKKYKDAEKQYQHCIQQTLSRHPQCSANPRELIATLNSRGFAGDTEKIKDKQEAIDFAEKELKTYFSSQEAVENYLNAIAQPGGLRLSCQCVLAYAQQNAISLRIWRKEASSSGRRKKLTLPYKTAVAVPSKTMHLMMSDQPNCFNLLICTKATQTKTLQSSIPTRSWSPTLFERHAQLEEENQKLAMMLNDAREKQKRLKETLSEISEAMEADINEVDSAKRNTDLRIEKLQADLLDAQREEDKVSREYDDLRQAIALKQERIAAQASFVRVHQDAALRDQDLTSREIEKARHLRYLALTEHHAAQTAQHDAAVARYQAEVAQHHAAMAIDYSQWLSTEAYTIQKNMVNYWEAVQSEISYTNLEIYRQRIQTYSPFEDQTQHVTALRTRDPQHYIMAFLELNQIASTSTSPYNFFILRFNPQGARIYVSQTEEGQLSLNNEIYLIVPKPNPGEPTLYTNIQEGLCCVYPNQLNQWTLLQNNVQFPSCDIKPLYPGYLYLEEGAAKRYITWVPGMYTQWPNTAHAAAADPESALSLRPGRR